MTTDNRITLDIEIIEQPQPIVQDQEDEEQQAAGGTPHEYVGTLLINGVHHHITLFAIDHANNGNQSGTTAHNDRLLTALCDFEDAYRFSPITIRNHHFLCVISPYAR